MSIDKNQFQAFEPDAEAKAFIYQQVQDLEQDIKNIGDLTVYVEKEELVQEGNNKVLENTFAVTFVIDPEHLNLSIRAESKDLFSACISAKAATRMKLSQILNHASGQEERVNQIDAALETKGWIH
ncbi:MAG: hypothetical protein KDD34_02915 [Bdellovibrionales bacterium]|nr:hypothetical protein [Bdellovibrionales bacterium]